MGNTNSQVSQPVTNIPSNSNYGGVPQTFDIETRGGYPYNLPQGQLQSQQQLPQTNNTYWNSFCRLFIKTSETDLDKYEINLWWWGFLIICAIIITSTISESFTYINYNQYALEKNNYGAVSLTPTYTQGRYFRTLNYGFVTFPSTFQPIDFESTVFADNGMEFILNVRLYYKIPKNNLGNIYNLYSQNYAQRVENNAMNVIKNVAPFYSANDYLTSRFQIEKNIASNISIQLYNIVGVIVPQQYVRITNIIFPEILIDTSLASALALQQNELNQLNQTAQLINSQTKQMVAQINADTQLLLQNTNNTATLFTQVAQNEANNIVNTARSNGISLLFDKLDITKESDKIAIINAMATYDNSNSTIFQEVFANSLQMNI